MAAHLHGGRQILRSLKWYRSLREHKGRRARAAFLVEGPRAVGQISITHPDRIVEILTETPDAYARALAPVRRITRRQLDAICVSRTTQGVAAVVRMPDGAYDGALPARPGSLVVVLDGVQDPGNVGTLIRSAAALGATGVLLAGTCADPFSPKVVQASSGSILSLWVRRTARCLELARELKARGYNVLATGTRGGASMPPVKSGRIMLVLGSEGAGLSKPFQKLADHVLTIPINTRRVESLNVSAAGAIALYLLACRHKA